MVILLIVINILFLIGYIFYTRNKKNKYGNLIIRKNQRNFNIILSIIFISYVILQTYLIYTSQPTTATLQQLRENKDSITTSGGRLDQAVICLIISPIFWVTLFRFYKEITESFFQKKYIKFKKNTNYYRGTLTNVSPAIVSFILENNINVSKAITADILKLKLFGYIIEEKNHLKCSDLDTSDLLRSEKILINAIKTNKFSDKEYIKAIEEEAIELKLLSKHKTKLKRLISIALNTCQRFLLLVLIIVGMVLLTIIDYKLIDGVFVFTNDNFSSVEDSYGENGNYYKARYIKVDEDIYNNLKEKREKEIIKLVEKELKNESNFNSNNNSDSSNYNIGNDVKFNLMKYKYTMQDIKEQLFFTNISGNHYIKASYVSVGMVSLDTLITLVQTSLTALFFLAIISIANIVRYIIVSTKYSNKYVLTNKGAKMRKEIKGLKKYLKNFSLIKRRTKEEVFIWEYYLIYAVVLHENFEIENELIKKFVKQIYIN